MTAADDPVRFVVYGRAAPSGSKRAIPIKHKGQFTGKVAVVADSKYQYDWQNSVRAAAAEMMDGRVPLDYPLSLSVAIYQQRPRGHYRTGQYSDRVRPGAPEYPTVKPDLTKLVRAIEDALIGIVIRDDSLVVWQQSVKRYGTPERAEISLSVMGPR